MQTWLPHWMTRNLSRRETLQLWAAILCLYVLSYLILSFFGRYVITESGNVRWGYTNLAVPDIVQWQPRYGFFQRFHTGTGEWICRANALGYFYAPLILLDQNFIHPTKPLLVDEKGRMGY